jgi:hypothetical protein
MDAWRRANLRLRDALAEAGWTGQQLATAVNTAGAEVGLQLTYDRTAVAHWLSGTRPRRPVPDLLAEVFSRQLARQVTAAGLGLAPETEGDARSAQPQDGDVSSVLTRLHTAGTQASPGPAYSLADLTVPGWMEARPVPVPRYPDRRVALTVADAEAAEHLVRVLSVGDATFGGGHVRRAAAAYLAADLGPKLHARMPPAIRRRLFVAATQMSYLCGFMCFDDELHGLGQRYYRISLQLAAQNGDRTGYAISLRALSVQAGSLGHHLHARKLAETAASGIRRLGALRQAFLYGQLAVARAADGDRSGALLSLAAAERHLDQATSATLPMGAYHIASFAHQQAVVKDLLGDRRGAISSLDTSIRHRPVGERRSRAITLALLAEFQLSAGYLDEAILTWHRFLDDYPQLNSGRVTAALHRLLARIRPFTKTPAAASLLRRASVYAAPSGPHTLG